MRARDLGWTAPGGTDRSGMAGKFGWRLVLEPKAACGPLRSFACSVLLLRGLGAAGYGVTSVSPGPVHCASASSRTDPALLLYLRSPHTPPPPSLPPPRSSVDARQGGAPRQFARRARASRGRMSGDRSGANVLGRRRLGVVGCRVTGGKGGGPEPVDARRLSGEPGRGTRRSPGTPPPRALSETAATNRTTATGRQRPMVTLQVERQHPLRVARRDGPPVD